MTDHKHEWVKVHDSLDRCACGDYRVGANSDPAPSRTVASLQTIMARGIESESKVGH